jgi:hypothetical protein
MNMPLTRSNRLTGPLLRRLTASIGLVVMLAGCQKPTTDSTPSKDSTANVTEIAQPVTTAATTTVAGVAATEVVTTAVTEDSKVAAVTETIVLRSDGLGIVTFGQDATEVIDALTKVLGKPTMDTGWNLEQIGCDIGEKIRDIGWNGFGIELSNGPSQMGPAGKEHLLTYYLNIDGDTKLPYQTDAGLKLGDSVATLKKLYPEAKISNSEIEGPVYSLTDSYTGLNGNLSSLDDNGTVDSIRAGVLCID